MEVEYVGKRAHLFHLFQQHPEWTLQQYADAVGCSQSMVCTWRQRFREAQAQGTLDASIFFSCSRAPHQGVAVFCKAPAREECNGVVLQL